MYEIKNVQRPLFWEVYILVDRHTTNNKHNKSIIKNIKMLKMVWRKKERTGSLVTGEFNKIPLLNGVVKRDLIEMVLFEQRLEGDEKASQEYISR